MEQISHSGRTGAARRRRFVPRHAVREIVATSRVFERAR
jgi:hypothetical protein